MTSASKQVFEGSAKVDVEDGVDDRVKSRVDVAQPNDAVNDAIVSGRGAVAAEGEYHVHEKERKPTDNERSHNNDHRTCSTTLLR